jgi:hypothetical protein
MEGMQMKSSSSNSFSFRCAVCRKACQPLHIVVVVMASFFNRRQHFCSVRCAASWLGPGV